MKRHLTTLVLLAASGIVAAHADAALLASDDFSTYTAGNINTQNGGGALTGFGATTWVADGGSGGDNIVGDTLTVTGDSFRARRAFSTQPLATTGLVYVRTNLTLGTAGFVALELATTLNSDANSTRIRIRNSGFEVETKGAGSASSDTFGSNAAIDEVFQNNEYLIEIDLDTQAGKVWFNPDTDNFDGTGGFAFTVSNDFELNGIQTAAFSGSGQLIILDDIQIGTTLGSVGVVPEPGSLALLGLGGLLIGTRRRRS